MPCDLIVNVPAAFVKAVNVALLTTVSRILTAFAAAHPIHSPSIIMVTAGNPFWDRGLISRIMSIASFGELRRLAVIALVRFGLFGVARGDKERLPHDPIFRNKKNANDVIFFLPYGRKGFRR
jgi:hypothetical protein